MTNLRTAAVVAVLLGLAAPVSSAMAFPLFAPDVAREARTPRSLGVHDGPLYEPHPGICAPSAAAEGNAAQQTRPVKQYGQTSGGNRC